MGKLSPHYRATLYERRDIDPTETTVLTPVAGSAHTEPFQVATDDINPNLFDNPQVDTVITGWSANAGTTVTRDTTVKPDGYTASAKVVNAGAASSGLIVQNLAGRPAVTAGKFYNASIAVYGTGAEGRAVMIRLLWYDAGGVNFVSDFGNVVALRSGWQRLSVKAVAPAGAVTARILVLSASSSYTQTAFTFWATCAMLEQSRFLGLYNNRSTAWRGYLNYPEGRRGKIDAKSRKSDIGSVLLSVSDPKAGSSGTEVVRWATAFHGDLKGLYRFGNLRCVYEESLDGGMTWRPFYTGRVYRSRRNTKLRWEFDVRDMGRLLDADVFVGLPHSTVTKVIPTTLYPDRQVFPAGITYGPITSYEQSTVGETGTTQNQNATARKFQVAMSATPGGGGLPYYQRWITARLKSAMLQLAPNSWGLAGPKGQVRATVRWAGGFSGTFNVLGFTTRNQTNGGTFPEMNVLSLEELLKPDGTPDTGAAGYSAVPANGLAVTSFHLFWAGKPTDWAPLWVCDCNPFEIVEWMAQGKLSRLNIDGSPKFTVPFDAAEMAALKADNTIGRFRGQVDKPDVINKWVEDNLCLAYNNTYYFDGLGQWRFKDLRLPTAAQLATAPVVSNALCDLTKPPEFEDNSDEPVTLVKYLIYKESRNDSMSSGVGRAALINRDEMPVEFIIGRDDLAANDEEYKCVGMSFFDGETMTDPASPGAYSTGQFGLPRLDYITGKLQENAFVMSKLFGSGAKQVTFTGMRDDPTIAALQPGTWTLVTVDGIPDPISRTLSGQRLVFVEERTEDGPRVKFSGLDSGLNVLVADPTIGALSTVANGDYGIDVFVASVALNADSDPVEFWICTTDRATVVRPADNDARWTYSVSTKPGSVYGGTFKVTTATKDQQRYWVRARSVPGPSNNLPKMPGNWVYPSSGLGYVDPGTLNPVSGLVVTPSALYADVTWVVGEPTVGIEILLLAPGDAVPISIIDNLTAGSTGYRIVGLTASTNYTVYVRHYDGNRSVSATVNAAFSTTAPTTEKCPNLLGLSFLRK